MKKNKKNREEKRRRIPREGHSVLVGDGKYARPAMPLSPKGRHAWGSEPHACVLATFFMLATLWAQTMHCRYSCM